MSNIGLPVSITISYFVAGTFGEAISDPYALCLFQYASNGCGPKIGPQLHNGATRILDVVEKGAFVLCATEPCGAETFRTLDFPAPEQLWVECYACLANSQFVMRPAREK